MLYRSSMFYLVRNEASYQSFEGSLYGLVCFYNKSVLVLEVRSVGAIIPTNFIVPKISFVPYKVKHISATNQ